MGPGLVRVPQPLECKVYSPAAPVACVLGCGLKETTSYS
jgi:hypothetical protein